MYQYTIPVDKITAFIDAIDEGEGIILSYVSKKNAYVILCNIAPEEFDAIEELAGVDCITYKEHYYEIQVFTHHQYKGYGVHKSTMS
jgi:hypothetical protein